MRREKRWREGERGRGREGEREGWMEGGRDGGGGGGREGEREGERGTCHPLHVSVSGLGVRGCRVWGSSCGEWGLGFRV